MYESEERAVWEEYFELKDSPENISDINQRLWYPKLGYPTLLQLAVYCNHEAFVEWLILRRADVNITTEVWGTALHVAVKHRRMEFIESLLKSGAIFNKLSSIDNCTPIYHLLEKEKEDQESQWTEIFKQCLKKKIDINEICIKPPSKPGLTPLEVAIKNNNLQAINFLLNFGADVDRVNALNMTPLEIASNQEARKLIMEHVIKLKMAGSSVSDKTWKIVMENPSLELNYLKLRCKVELEFMKKLQDKTTGLFYVQVLRRSEKELCLFKKLSNSEMATFCEKVKSMFIMYSEILASRVWKARFVTCPVFEREMKKKYLALKQNLENIKYINERQCGEQYGSPTILQLAVFYGDEGFISKLLKEKADVNIVTDVWGTALHIAVMNKKHTIAEKLIKAGAKIDEFSSVHNCTPIYHLLKNNKSFSPPIVRMLVRKGLDLNQVCIKTSSETGLTPLEVAIVGDSKSLMQGLLDFGADVNHINANNMTPLDLADSLKTLKKPWQFKNVIKRHIVKLIATKRKVSVRNRDAVAYFFDTFLGECESEIEVMKTVKVPATNICYFDAVYKSNEQLKRVYKTSSEIDVDRKIIESMFPNYAGLLINRFTTIKFKKLIKNVEVN